MIPSQRPLQKRTWAEKNDNKQQFFKDNIDWGIGASIWRSGDFSQKRAQVMLSLYEIYNSKFPSAWFSHVTNPFSSEKAQHQQWGGKIRPANIIRPNIDLLRGEYEERPFEFHAEVKGEQGYNNFLEARKKAVYDNLSQIFINGINEDLATQNPEGDGPQTEVDSKQVQMPEQVAAQFAGDYKDLIAIQAQAELDIIMEEEKIHEKLSDCMKDWLIAGEAYTWKGVYRDKVRYERVSPLEIDHDKSPDIKYVEDGSWACRRVYMTMPDIVDRYYESLKEEDITNLENMSALSSPGSFYSYLQSNEAYQHNKIPVYHFQWKGLQKIGHLTGADPLTGTPYEDLVNDTYKANPELGEQIEWEWVTQVLEGTRIGDDLYVEMGQPAYQTNQIVDFSKDKLSYNGKKFSDTHADNISVAKLGLPFQIMYVILFFTLEKTIAKSRGDIILLDKNTIPTKHGWDEEKFFYYAEAQGYMLVDRNQTGVDKSWNQYQVLKSSTYEHIKELINILNFCRDEYDQQLGINRQRKAQTFASDSATGNRDAYYQSSVITEMIFADFDGLVKADMQGIIDCSQIANRNGKLAAYRRDDVGMALLEINPDMYCYMDIGISMVNNAKDNAALNRVRQYTQALAQNNLPASALVEIETSNNIAKLKGILKNVEAKQAEMQEAAAQSEHEKEVNKIQLQQQFSEYENLLEIGAMHEEYTRKEELVILQGDINLAITGAKEGNPVISPESGGEIGEILDRQIERDKAYQQRDMHERTENNKDKMDARKATIENKKLEVKNKEIASKERMAQEKNKVDLKIARMKPKPSAKK